MVEIKLMSNPIASALRAASRKEGEPLNILTAPTHEAYESNLCKTGHNFYAIRAPGIKDWNTKYRLLPENYILLDPSKGEKQLPPEVDFDLILSQNKFGQFQVLSNLSRLLHVPMISLEHTLPVPSWPDGHLDALKNMRGDVNVFISEYSRAKWGWKPEDALVVHHGIDTELFKPASEETLKRVPKVSQLLSVVNDWVNRNWCCGWELYQQIVKDLPVKILGDTPGISKPASSTQDLVEWYQVSSIFLNTSLISPVPTALMEAMACGCACVSTATCMIPEIIEHGVDGFLSNDPQELRKYCQLLLNDHKLASKMGQAARNKIVEHFHLDRFVKDWNRIFRTAAEIPYGV